MVVSQFHIIVGVPKTKTPAETGIDYTTIAATDCPIGQDPSSDEEEAACAGCVMDDPPCGCMIPLCNQVVCATRPEVLRPVLGCHLRRLRVNAPGGVK